MSNSNIPGLNRTAADRSADKLAHAVEAGQHLRNVSERAKQARARMTRVDGFALKLEAKPIPGFHLCFVNDDGRVEAYMDRGYDFVQNAEQGIEQATGDTGGRVRRLAGRKSNGEPLYAYLMKIPQEWFEEDQATEQKRLDMIEQTIRRGGEGRKDAAAKQYVPGQAGERKFTADAVTLKRNSLDPRESA